MKPDLNSGVIFMTGLVWLASYDKQLSALGFSFYSLIPPGYDASLLAANFQVWNTMYLAITLPVQTYQVAV